MRHGRRLLLGIALLLVTVLAYPLPAQAEDATLSVPATAPPSVTLSIPAAVRAGRATYASCAASGVAEATATIVVEVAAEAGSVWTTVASAESAVTDGHADARASLVLGRGRWLVRARLVGDPGAVSASADVAAVGPKVIALTFDDGPSPRITESIMRTLKARGVHATFFVSGVKARTYPRVVRAQMNAGHTVGSHGYLHKPLRGRSRAFVRAQVSAARAELIRATGAAPRWFRPPYGSTDAGVGSAIRANGMRQVIWTVDTLDWRFRNTSSVVRRGVVGRDGGVVLMHDAYATTARAVPSIISSYRSRGFDFVTLDELGALGYRIR
ncbi:MAG TPA: polysaccharide deacetylase family protein [Coriobacteriia bacterium]